MGHGVDRVGLSGAGSRAAPETPFAADLVGSSMIAAAVAVAFEFAYCVVGVGANPLFPLGTAGTGYVATLAWSRIIPFFALLALIEVVLVVGGVGVIRFGW